MPYITQEKRTELDKLIKPLIRRVFTKGQLNYVVTKFLHEWVMARRISYSALTNAVSVLQDAADEFKRTVLAKYEDKKRRENGPISDLDSKTMEDVR